MDRIDVYFEIVQRDQCRCHFDSLIGAALATLCRIADKLNVGQGQGLVVINEEHTTKAAATAAACAAARIEIGEHRYGVIIANRQVFRTRLRLCVLQAD